MVRTFQAFAGFYNDGEVWVCEDGKRVARLNPHLEVMNKSPSGFGWGYGGSGPAQLSFALLAAVIGVERAKDPRMFQRFKASVVSLLDQQEGWVMTETFIQRWVTRELVMASEELTRGVGGGD